MAEANERFRIKVIGWMGISLMVGATALLAAVGRLGLYKPSGSMATIPEPYSVVPWLALAYPMGFLMGALHFLPGSSYTSRLRLGVLAYALTGWAMCLIEWPVLGPPADWVLWGAVWPLGLLFVLGIDVI